jgi:pyruvate/2-oxoglutarate dehydrogenase complex dihydrolipoamide dehydrogenase (E3) component
VHLSETLTPEEVEAQGPDAVIVAIGSKTAMPPIPGLEKAVPVTEAYAEPEKLGRKVVILGGGMAGTELSIYLHSLGRDPVVVEMADALNFGTNTCHAIAANEQLTNRKIEIRTGTKVTAVGDGFVDCETADGKLRLEADSVVNALGRLPLQEEAAAYALSAPIFYPIGDCLTAKTIAEANRLGYNVAMDIGK